MGTENGVNNKSYYNKFPRNLKANVYTREQKIVAAVWYHEREYTGITIDDITGNFILRFKMAPPSITTISKWEKELFSRSFTVEKPKNVAFRNCSRFVHVPYVRESLRTHPDLNLKSRAAMLGLSLRALKAILEIDLKKFPSDEQLEEMIEEEMKNYSSKRC